MSKILKTVSAILGIIAVFMMFVPQVAVHWSNGDVSTLGVQALFGGDYAGIGTDFTGVTSGFVGYMLIAGGILLVLACAFLAFFKEHDILNILVMIIGIILLIVGTVLLFTIRYTFSEVNGLVSDAVYVGGGAIAGGSLGALSAAAATLGLLLDFAK
jgi:hypothetical protein